MPLEFITMLTIAKGLKFDEKPDYQNFKNLFKVYYKYKVNGPK